MTSFHCFTVNPFQQNTWLAYKNGEAILFDAGFYGASEINLLLDFLEDKNLELKACLLTHAHVDHILGLQPILGRFDIPVYLSHEDLNLWENFFVQASTYGFNAQPFDFTPKNYPASGEMSLGNFNFKAIYTPGHSPDHVSFYFKDDAVIIAGDVLFRESIGRTDLYKGNFSVLENVIKNKFYTLPDETRVLSGHGPETTIGYEKKHNQFVKP